MSSSDNDGTIQPGTLADVLGRKEKHILQRAVERIGNSDDFRARAYTGRGMGNRQCLGVSIADLGEFIAEMIRTLECFDDEGRELIADAFERMRTDQLGKGTVVYFPGIPFTEVAP